MKHSKTFKIVLALLCIICTERFCRSQTAGFRLSKTQTEHIYPFYEEFKNPPSDFCKTFHFLGAGVQFYVFIGDDGKTILKLFKHHHGWFSTDFIETFFPKFLAAPMVQQRENRMVHLLKSAQIAAQDLSSTTGVYYTHLSKTKSLLGEVKIYDKLGIGHALNLDQTEFLLQKAAEPLGDRLHRLFRSRQVDEAILTMQQTIKMLSQRAERGVKNKDGRIVQNCGFFENEPAELDVGSFIYRPNRQQKTALKARKKLLKWVTKYYPENIKVCEESI